MKQLIDRIQENIRSVISIDPQKLEHLMAAMLAGGHVILADTHGVGKTSLARALAGSIRWPEAETTSDGVDVQYFSRIQCTVDLLPQDILGYTRIGGEAFTMIFNRGPIFSNFVLCDEINLLTPKTQGSFFQAMEEQQVSIEGTTYDLPELFFLIATMNLEGAHLFPLPAPQLDRFMLQMSLGYPAEEAEVDIVMQHGRNDSWKDFGPVADSSDILSCMAAVDSMEVHPEVIKYIVRLVRATREHPELKQGASPRTGVKLSRMVRALALVRGRDFPDIDMVKEIALPAMNHRLEHRDSGGDTLPVLRSILEKVPADPMLGV